MRKHRPTGKSLLGSTFQGTSASIFALAVSIRLQRFALACREQLIYAAYGKRADLALDAVIILDSAAPNTLATLMGHPLEVWVLRNLGLSIS